MTVQEFLGGCMQILSFSVVYYSVQIMRCVLFSFPVLGTVMILRKTVFKNAVFLKGMLWSLFIPLMFIGRMKFFYETAAGVRMFIWINSLCFKYTWLCWLYFSGAVIFAASLYVKRKRLKKFITEMEKTEICRTKVFISDISVTPFSFGAFCPRIVLPEVIIHEYSREELEMIILHERNHIKLGHLVIYLFWDILRAILWLNPLLTVCTRYLRQDMEEICDKVTIKGCSGKVYEYGHLLLKSIRLLRKDSREQNMMAAFTCENDYKDIKRRITMVAEYKPYKKAAARSLAVFALVCAVASAGFIKSVSYDRCNTIDTVSVIAVDDLRTVAYDYELNGSIKYDDDYIYVDSQALRSAFNPDEYRNKELAICFGGFYKLPGIGGGGDYRIVKGSELCRDAKIAYEHIEDTLVVKLIKLI